MDIDEAFRESNDEAIIAHLNKDYDTKNDPEKLLRLAAHYGREKVIAACLEAGIVPDSHGALCWACGEGQMRPIKMLVSAGANINLRDDWGRAPITQSAGHGKLNQVKYLLKQGARIDGALSAAVDGEYTKLVEFLVTQGANIEEQGDGKLFTPLINNWGQSKNSSPHFCSGLQYYYFDPKYLFQQVLQQEGIAIVLLRFVLTQVNDKKGHLV